MQVNGLDELNQKLHALRQELGNKDTGGILYQSLMFASVPMYEQIKAAAPVSAAPYRRYMSSAQGDGVYYDNKGKKHRRRAKRGTGRYQTQNPSLYKNSIKRRRLTKGLSAHLDGAAIAIYVAEGSGKTFGSAYYWFFNEYGAYGNPPRPIFRPAFANGYDTAENRFVDKLGQRIDQVMQ